MALILKRRKPAPSTDNAGEKAKGKGEGNATNFLADANESMKASPVDPENPPETRVATAPKKLVIKGKKTPQQTPESMNKAPERAEEPVKAPIKAVNPYGLQLCSYCKYERKEPCHGSTEHRGSYDKDGNPLECASKRLVDRLRSEGKDPFGKPLEKAA